MCPSSRRFSFLLKGGCGGEVWRSFFCRSLVGGTKRARRDCELNPDVESARGEGKKLENLMSEETTPFGNSGALCRGESPNEIKARRCEGSKAPKEEVKNRKT